MIKKEIKKILCVRLDRLGDLVLTLPGIYALKKHNPDIIIDIAINKENENLVSGLSYINSVIIYNRSEGLFGLIKLLKNIRATKYDGVFQLLPGSNFKSNFLVAYSNSPVKVGYNLGILGKFFTHRIEPHYPEYETNNVLEILKEVFPELSFDGWGLEVEKEILNSFKEKFKNNSKEKLIVIHTQASEDNPRKIWPVNNFITLFKQIKSLGNSKILLIGSKKDAEVAQIIKKGVPEVLDLTGSLTLKELKALISICDIFIGNNSGPLQIAVALNCPTVSLIGPSLQSRWAPKGQIHSIIKKDFSCIPCEGKKLKCYDNICMKKITVEEVYSAVKKQLNIK